MSTNASTNQKLQSKEAELTLPDHETRKQIERYTRRAKHYDGEVRLLNFIMGDHLRKRLFEGQYKRILEVGVGTGSNLTCYPAGVEAHAIDITPTMINIARQRAEKQNLNIQFNLMDVCSLDYPDNYFDRVVGSCLFCSVPNPVAGLREIRRVVKPDGEVRLLEHMLPELPLLRWFFGKLDPILYRKFGFHIARRTLDNIQLAGFQIKTDVVRLFRIFHYLELGVTG